MLSSTSLKRFAAAAVLGAAAIISGHAAPGELDQLRQRFMNPPDDARIMMRWWWFGSAVTKPELEREMKVMKEGGIGGFEVQPVYPLELDDPKTGFVNLPYLSDGYLDALKFAAGKSRELGLRMDVTLGSGWPFGGPHTPVTEAAGALRCDHIVVPANAASIPMPAFSNGETFIAAFLAKGDKRQFDAAGIQQLSKFEANRILLPAGVDGNHVVLAFFASRSGMQVKRPAVNAEGFVLDHYDRAAIEHHLNTVGTKLMQAFGSHPPYSVFSDSLEVFGSDWTPELMTEFQKRRGYDLTPYLPALVGDIGEKTGSVRRDWGRTLTELTEERYLTPISEWAHKHGTKFRSQTYGEPPVVLSSNALVDLPEGEAGPRWRTFSTVRWASSASHLYNRPVTSSETWTWLHSPAFRATPLDMKAEADLHFLQGINQFVGHGWAYSPKSAGEPGWRFYAAAVFNEHNPWWIVMPDVTRYMQRVSFLMRQGKPANDIAVYIPTDDAYENFRAGGQDSVDRSMDQLLGPNLVPQILDAGFNFDFIDDGAIGKLGVPYPILILPNVQRIPLATLRKLNDYVEKGGIVVALKRMPSLAPGLQDAGDTAQIRTVAAAMKVHSVADDARLGSTLAGLMQPDFAANNPAIGFIHRKLPGGDIYFVANTGNQPVHTKAVIRAKNVAGEWWDPFTGAAVSTPVPGGIAVDLEPYESRVLAIFTGSGGAQPAAKAPSVVADIAFPNASWTDIFSGSRTLEQSVNIPAVGSRLFIDFGPGTPVPPSRMANGMRAWLDAPVREAATVYVNGQLAGYVWHPPFRVDITKFAHAGANQIKVVVANTAINELAGQSLPDYKLLTLKYGNRFQPQDMDNLKPLPSGILGRVTLISD
ncbi:MAG: glycoside hydrolase [Acidobacteriota bacterium]|nr:glycoside hydrolase [Acidobacteriota bacterium]